MGFVMKTAAGTFRANWRDPAGRQKSKTFKTKKEANAYLAEVESAVNRGTYVAPNAGRVRFHVHTERWAASRHLADRTNERTASVLRCHVLPKWSDWPIGKIDNMAVQGWVTDLGKRLAPATVAKCFGVLRLILRSALRARLIATDPTEGVTVPSTYQARPLTTTITRAQFFGNLLPAIPVPHRAIVATAAGAGLRWGECAGLTWGAVDLDEGLLKVVQVAVETSGTVMLRPFPKTRAGWRTVPLPGWLIGRLHAHREHVEGDPGPRTLVFATSNGTGLRRSNFRRQVWRPALVRAGLLGSVVELQPRTYRATWSDKIGMEWSKDFPTERDAVAHVAEHAHGGLRFHDLRHSYATWLVSDGVPVNIVRKVMGHERTSTTLDRYTHTPADYAHRVRDAMDAPADFPLTPADETDPEPDEDDGHSGA
jgi:integrase